MKKILLIVLLLSFGFSQKLTEVVETYDNGNIKSITYHKKSRTGIEKVKYEEYYENGQKKAVTTFKDSDLISEKFWDSDGKKRLTPPIKSADEYFSAAEIERNAKNIKASLENLDNLIKHYPEHVLAPQAQYLIADIYLDDLRDFDSAIAAYVNVVNNFSGTNQEAQAQFMIGYIYANVLDDFEQAMSTYQTFLEKFPNHELASSVKFELESLGKDINEIPVLKHTITPKRRVGISSLTALPMVMIRRNRFSGI